MKMCLTEIMKDLSCITKQKRELNYEISSQARIKYYAGEDVDRSFDFNESLSKLNELIDKEVNYKYILADKNANTYLIDYSEKITIAQGLIKLASLSRKLDFFQQFKDTKNQVEKKLVKAQFQGDVDRIEISEKLYDVKLIDELLKNTSKEINKLQIAIDRTNLLTKVDI